MTHSLNVVELKPNQDAFEDFWQAYPRRVGKAKARRLFEAITSPDGYKTRTLCKDSGTYIELHLEATPDELIKAAKAYYQANRKQSGYGFVDEGRYLLHPTTFLNSGRFEDYL